MLNNLEFSVIYRHVNGCHLALVALFQMSSSSRSQTEGVTFLWDMPFQVRGEKNTRLGRTTTLPWKLLFNWRLWCPITFHWPKEFTWSNDNETRKCISGTLYTRRQVTWQLGEMYHSLRKSKWLSVYHNWTPLRCLFHPFKSLRPAALCHAYV